MSDEGCNEIDVPLKSGGLLTARARAGDREPIYIGWCRNGETLPDFLAELTDEECNQLCRAIRNLQGAARGRRTIR